MDGGNSVHIAGLGCVFNGGYNGHRISVEEMKVGTIHLVAS